jgi:hypothetical protein
MKVSLEFPETASLMRFDHDYLKAVLIATLYHLGQLSEHEACVALGVTRRAFEELFRSLGSPCWQMIKRPSTLNGTHDGGEAYCQQYRAADLITRGSVIF